jgi:hypothetical protein
MKVLTIKTEVKNNFLASFFEKIPESKFQNVRIFVMGKEIKSISSVSYGQQEPIKKVIGFMSLN